MAVRVASAVCVSIRALFALLLALASSARAADPPDAPLPDIAGKQLAEKVKAAREAASSGLLEVEYEEERDADHSGRGAPVMVKIPGKVRFIGDGRRWRVDSDSMTPGMGTRDLSPDRWSSGFDGSERFHWWLDRKRVTYGESEALAATYAPRELFWLHADTLLGALGSPTTTVGQRTVDGFRCYVVTARRGELSSETAISPRQGYLPLRMSWFRDGRLYLASNLADVREVSPGIWAPGRIFSLARAASPADSDRVLIDRRLSRVVRFEPGKTFEASAFRLDPPLGADVTDDRLGYSYHNDPWWPEVGKLLRERFDWPRVNLSWLGILGTQSDAMLEGEPAPPIRAAAWLNSPPLGWEQLRGKVTLLDFWSVSSPPFGREMAALRRLYETYHPSGFEIIAIHAPTDDPDEVRRFARDRRMPFPVVIDQALGDTGATAKAYGVIGFPCTFLVEPGGRVRKMGDHDARDLIDTLIGLLKQSGAVDVPARPVDPDQLSREMIDAITNEFHHRWAGSAPATGRIRGTVKDAQQREVAGATVEATEHLRVLYGTIPGGYYLIRGRSFKATAGPDGRFELPGLCKGTYSLVFRAEGKAGVEATATIAPDLAPATADAVLDRGDAIEGIVRDESGKPVAGADLEAKERRVVARDGSVSRTAIEAARVTADAEGRFRLETPLAGEYLVEVTARGFERSTPQWIPAGSTGVTAVLKRPKP